jgi:hypothetical protein
MINNNLGTGSNNNLNSMSFTESISFSGDNVVKGGFSYVYQGENSLYANRKGTNKCTVTNNCEGANCTFRCGKSSE